MDDPSPRSAAPSFPVSTLDLISALEKPSFTQARSNPQSLTLADVEDLVFYEESFKEEVEEKEKNDIVLQSKEEEKKLSTKTRKMRRTRNIKIRQKFSDKIHTNVCQLNKVKASNRRNKQLDDTRCLKNTEY